jgi:hypothetical protein
VVVASSAGDMRDTARRAVIHVLDRPQLVECLAQHWPPHMLPVRHECCIDLRAEEKQSPAPRCPHLRCEPCVDLCSTSLQSQQSLLTKVVTHTQKEPSSE